MNGFLIGRFQPFHLGHLETVNFALQRIDKLFIGIGSSNISFTARNPFTADEREEMIKGSINDWGKIKIFKIPDFNDHEKWVSNINKMIPNFDTVFSNDSQTVNIFEKRKVSTTSTPLVNRKILSGTNIREYILEEKDWSKLVPDGTRDVLIRMNAHKRLSEIKHG